MRLSTLARADLIMGPLHTGFVDYYVACYKSWKRLTVLLLRFAGIGLILGVCAIPLLPWQLIIVEAVLAAFSIQLLHVEEKIFGSAAHDEHGHGHGDHPSQEADEYVKAMRMYDADDDEAIKAAKKWKALRAARALANLEKGVACYQAWNPSASSAVPLFPLTSHVASFRVLLVAFGPSRPCLASRAVSQILQTSQASQTRARPPPPYQSPLRRRRA